MLECIDNKLDKSMTVSNDLVQCKICLEEFPLEESYKRKKCNEACNAHLTVHKNCYQTAMSLKDFLNRKCPWCNVLNPEGTFSCPTFNMQTAPVLAGAVWVASAITVSLLDHTNECCLTNGTDCVVSTKLVSLSLVCLMVLSTAVVGLAENVRRD